MNPIKLILLFLTLCLLAGCNIGGPAYPGKGSYTYLSSIGKPPKEIFRLQQGEKLTKEEFSEYSKCPDINVRFIAATNPHITPEQLDLFVNDKSDFVRSGAARNRNLTRKHMEKLMQDRSHTVYCSLAGNPAVDDDILLFLREEKDLDLAWLVMNPNCPESIKRKVSREGDWMSSRWLKITNQWKQKGVFKQDENGRWYRAKYAIYP